MRTWCALAKPGHSSSDPLAEACSLCSLFLLQTGNTHPRVARVPLASLARLTDVWLALSGSTSNRRTDIPRSPKGLCSLGASGATSRSRQRQEDRPVSSRLGAAGATSRRRLTALPVGAGGPTSRSCLALFEDCRDSGSWRSLALAVHHLVFHSPPRTPRSPLALCSAPPTGGPTQGGNPPHE